MANIKSQKKRIRQDEKKNLRNKDKKTALRSSIKAILNSETDVEKDQKIQVSGLLFLYAFLLFIILFVSGLRQFCSEVCIFCLFLRD